MAKPSKVIILGDVSDAVLAVLKVGRGISLGL